MADEDEEDTGRVPPPKLPKKPTVRARDALTTRDFPLPSGLPDLFDLNLDTPVSYHASHPQVRARVMLYRRDPVRPCSCGAEFEEDSTTTDDDEDEDDEDEVGGAKVQQRWMEERARLMDQAAMRRTRVEDAPATRGRKSSFDVGATIRGRGL